MTNVSTPTEVVQSMFEAFARGDTNSIVERVTPDCRWVVPGQGIPVSGTYQGKEGAARFFQKLKETERITRFEPREYFANGDAVVVLGFEEAEAISTGKKGQTNWAMLFRLRDDKVYHYESFFDTETAAQLHVK